MDFPQRETMWLAPLRGSGIGIYEMKVVVKQRARDHDEAAGVFDLRQVRQAPLGGSALRDHFHHDSLEVAVPGIVRDRNVKVVVVRTLEIAIHRLSGIRMRNADQKAQD